MVSFIIDIPPKVRGVISIYLMPAVGRIVIGSEAIRENQGLAVLLHRIDEELLHRTVLHSVTS